MRQTCQRERQPANYKFEIREWSAFTFYENTAANHSRFLLE